MHKAEFIVRMVEVGAWPAVTLILGLLLRKPVFDLIGRLTKLKVGDTAVDFGNVLQPAPVQPESISDSEINKRVGASKQAWEEFLSQLSKAEDEFLLWLMNKPSQSATGLEIVNVFMNEILHTRRIYISRADFGLIRDKLLRKKWVDFSRDPEVGNRIVLTKDGQAQAKPITKQA